MRALQHGGHCRVDRHCCCALALQRSSPIGVAPASIALPAEQPGREGASFQRLWLLSRDRHGGKGARPLKLCTPGAWSLGWQGDRSRGYAAGLASPPRWRSSNPDPCSNARNAAMPA